MTKESDGREKTILDSINEGVFTVDMNWCITAFNRAAELITHVNRKEALGTLENISLALASPRLHWRRSPTSYRESRHFLAAEAVSGIERFAFRHKILVFGDDVLCVEVVFVIALSPALGLGLGLP